MDVEQDTFQTKEEIILKIQQNKITVTGNGKRWVLCKYRTYVIKITKLFNDKPKNVIQS
jgi:hypothetical protein